MDLPALIGIEQIEAPITGTFLHFAEHCPVVFALNPGTETECVGPVGVHQRSKFNVRFAIQF